MTEFELIDRIVGILGPAAEGGVIGPGDDASAIRPPEGTLLISSIDTLVGGVHFPEDAPGELVGYRAMMVSLSDLAAMGAEPAQVLVGMTLEATDQEWALDVARGMKEASLETRAPLLGGNLARGGRSLTMSVHGFCPENEVMKRSGATPGHGIYVTGPLGGAAAAVRRQTLADLDDPLTRRYFRPKARFDVIPSLKGKVSSVIDVSDGLLQDLGHLCDAGGVGAELVSADVPIAEGARLDDALHGGDDYELLYSAAEPVPGIGAARIGTVTAGGGILLDGEPVAAKGYQHFL